MNGKGDGAWTSDRARASLHALAMLPYVGHLIGLILLPRWCYESVIEASVRSGRSAASLVVWALGWSTVMAVAIALLSVLGFLVGWAAVATITLLLAPFAIGAIVGWRTPGLGGLGIGFVGLLIAGAIAGIVLSAIAVVVRFIDPSTEGLRDSALAYIPAMTLAVPMLTGAQFGIGLVVASLAGRRRWPRR